MANNAAYYHWWKNYWTARSAGGFSTEALAAFAFYDSLGDGLTDSEKVAMATYIDAEVANGNHAKKDYETIYSLSGANALVDYIGGKVATAVNAPTQSVNGYTFDGATQYLDSNFNPNADGVNYQLNNAQVEVFIKTFLGSPSTIYKPFGVEDGTNGANLFTQTDDSIRGLMNDSGSLNKYRLSGWVNNELISIFRDISDKNSYSNGIIQTPATRSSTNVVSANFYIGKSNAAGERHFPGTISIFMVGGVLTDQPGHYTNLSTLLTALQS